MSTELTPVEAGVAVSPTLVKCEERIVSLVRGVDRSQRSAIEHMERARVDTERANIEVGGLLNTIKEGRLYKEAGFKSWGAYRDAAGERLKVGERRVRQLMAGAKTERNLNRSVSEARPNEWQLRELARAGDAAPVVWKAVTEQHDKPTAALIHQEIKRTISPTPPEASARTDGPDVALLASVQVAVRAAVDGGWSMAEIKQSVNDAHFQVTQ